jgi:hypothetical protein
MRYGKRYYRADREACRDGKSIPTGRDGCTLGFVHFVDPELAAHLLDKIVNFVGVHREGFYKWPQLTFWFSRLNENRFTAAHDIFYPMT